MKISVIITAILVAQVSASFLDVFHGAVLSVQNGFGKLLNDVVTDVKDTVDCTILAVEHVLSLSPDATARYYDKCGTNKTNSVSDARQDASLPNVEFTLNLPDNEEFLQKVIPAEIDEKINETLSKVLDNNKSHDNVLSIEKVLAKESEQLAGVSGLVKKELEKLSNDFTTDLKSIDKQRDSQPSVDTILQEIKVLEKRELVTKNASEAHKIHQVVDQVLGKLDTIEATEATENIKLQEILKELENNSNNSLVGLRYQFEQWKEEESRHLSEIKSKIEEHDKISELHNGSHNRPRSNQTHSILFIKDMKRDGVDTVDPISSYIETSSNNTTQIKDILDNSTSSRTLRNGKTLTSVASDVSFSRNKTFEYSGVNDTVKTNNSYFNTERSIRNEVIHPFESLTSVKSSELSRSVNQSTTTNDNTKEALKKTALGFTDKTPLNENHQVNDNTTESEKQKPLATWEPTVTIISTNGNNSKDTVVMSNPTQGLEIEDVKLHVKSKNDSKELSFDSAYNNLTFTRSTVETELTATSQNKNNLNDTVINNKNNAVVKKIFENTTNPVNIVSSTFPTNELVSTLATFDDIKSNDAIISTSSTIKINTLVNKTIIPIETTSTIGNVESSTVTTIIVQNSDNSDDTKITGTTIPNHSNEVVIESVSLQTVQNQFLRDNLQIEETSNTISNNTTITSYSSPIVQKTTISQTFEPKKTITPLGNEESLNTSNESMVPITSLPIIENTLNDIFKVNEAITTSKIENGSLNTTITSPNPIVSTSESTSEKKENIQAMGRMEPIDLTTTETADCDDNSTLSIVTNTSDTISESKLNENVAASENKETLSLNTLAHTDSDSITGAPLPLSEITTVSEIIDLVEGTTPIENEEPTILTAKLATIRDEVKNVNTGSNETVASTTKNVENIKKVKTTAASEDQDLSSTSTHSAINEIVITSIPLPVTDRIPISVKAPENTYRPPGLTTYMPTIPEPRANNYKSSSMNYDSFFHMSPRNSEAHKRALKEALQLIANSKRSDRIINNIMKNKNKFNARSIFNG